MSFRATPRRISVAMGTYNCAPTLAESIDSLLAQTFTDWELIMCDDASTDSTLEIAREYERKYDNIKVISHSRNQGLAASLNDCIAQCSPGSEFIARQDGDDISLPTRFETQVKFLDAHPEYALVSTAMINFDQSGDWGVQRKPCKPTRRTFANTSPFCHAPVMMRQNALEQVGFYTVSPLLRRGQDFWLWHKFYLAGFKGYNLQEPYYKMRDDRAASSRRTFKSRLQGARVQIQVMRNLGLSPWLYPKALRGIIVGLLPKPLYDYLHKKNIQKARRANVADV